MSLASYSPSNKPTTTISNPNGHMNISSGGCPFAYFAHGAPSGANTPIRSRNTSPMPMRSGTVSWFTSIKSK